MPDRETLYGGLSKAAWGYLLLNVDINLGTVSILPRFVGYFLLLMAVNRLSEERRDLLLLRPLCLLLAGWAFGDWLLSWFGQDLDGKFLFLDLLTDAASLYFHFQFLTDMAALAESFQEPDSGLDHRLCRCRTVYLVLVTLVALVLYLPLPGREWIVIGLGLAVCVTSFLVMLALFELRRCLG